MLSIDKSQIDSQISYEELIGAIRRGFAENYCVPTRHHHEVNVQDHNQPSTLLLMPAWDSVKYLGVKQVIVTPENLMKGLPSINGTYLLSDIRTGQPLAQIDAKTLTSKRTAATSALAASALARADSQSMLMVGTGAMAPYLIEAHCSILPIKAVFIWGRDFEKAKNLSRRLQKLNLSYEVLPAQDLQSAVEKVDLISCATMSEKPLIKGEWLRSGQHIDLVGSYKPTMREADDLVIKRSSLFADITEQACQESGDFAQPLALGILAKSQIKADLYEICREPEKVYRAGHQEITLFKSVGHGIEDLAAAILIYEKFI